MQRYLPHGLIVVLMPLLIWAAFFWDPSIKSPESEIASPEEPEPVIAAAPTGGDFTLQSYRGPVSLNSLRGKVVALFFGYTRCPDVCPMSLGYLGLAFNELSPDELSQIQGLFVSVDPERDTLDRLKDYGEYFHPKILGITGEPAEVAEIARRYGAGYRKVEQELTAGYTIDHTADIYLIDRRGRLGQFISHGTPPSRILDGIRELLRDD